MIVVTAPTSRIGRQLLRHLLAAGASVRVIVSAAQMAEIMSEVLGCEIVYRQITLDAYREHFLTLGFSQGMAEGMVAMMRAKSQGLDLGVRRTAEHSTPTTFRQWCENTLAPLFSS